MTFPKVYLISRKLTDEQRQKVTDDLSITPLSAIIVCDPRDIELAKNFCENAALLQHPVAVLADFDSPLTAINEDGSLCPLP